MTTATKGKRAAARQPKAPFASVPAPNRVDYPLLERDTQALWDKRDIMGLYLSRNEGSPRRWSFLDGPITSNNPMGVHHAWGRAYKDLFQRFNTMRGFRQRYQNGFDCQGLWVEVEVEKELGFKNKRDIEAYGVAKFVERCKARVLTFAERITSQSIRLGQWEDWSNSYFTMSDENNYTIWGFLKTCWERGWIYHGEDSMPWCPRCATGISDMEINEGRKEVTHTSVFVRLPLVGREREYLLVWTTTPWTLPANVACAVNPALTYARVEQDGDTYYLAHGNVAAAPPKGKEGKVAPKVNDALATLRRLRGHEHGEATITGTLKGSEMLGWRYRGPFDELAAWRETGAEHRVIAWDDVTADEGTGIVHMAPGCGREDYQLGKREGLAVLAPVDESGVYHEGYGFLTGQSTAEVARAIFDSLREKGYFYQTESYKHVYPHCWRCKTELIFRLVDEWFISMGSLDAPGDNLRKRLVRITQDITWIPGFGLERELDWLRNMEDWMISKKRYWGLALPIWRCEACERFEIIGSKEELRERAVAGWEEFEGHTPHRPWVDAVKIACSECGQLCSRVLDVGNPWLDAGIVSFSTLRYATDRDYWRQWFPADFITESFPGQFRNWFYSLLVMAAALEDTKPFRTVLGFATLLDEFGKEMHKSAGNSIPFDEAAEIVGSDTMRWLFINQTPEQNLNFPRIPSVEDAKKARAAGLPPRLSDLWMQSRAPLDKLWNVYSFFVTYANIDGFDPAAHRLAVTKRTDLDRWLLSEVQDTTHRVTDALEAFDCQAGAFALAELIEDLSNWYVRRSRRRFWKAEEDADKVGAYLTLYECLVTLTKLLAPFTPFIAETMYQNLVCGVDRDAPESVHLCDWPKARASLTFPALRDDTALVMRVVALGRAAREKAQLRVRQPLGALYVRVTSDAEAEALARLADQVREELNVKRVELLLDGSDMLHYTVQPRMSVLGPKLGKLLPATLATLRSGDMRAASRELRDHGRITLRVDGQEVTLTSDDVEVEASAREGYVAAEDRGYVVALDTSLSPELVAEGLSRDLTHLLQEARKHAGLDIQDHIEADLWTDRALATMLAPHHAYLANETLSQRLEVHTGTPDGAARGGVYEEAIPAEKLGGHALTLRLRKG